MPPMRTIRTTRTIPSQPSDGAPEARPRATWRQNIITVALATVMELGGILDGWAHGHIPELETVLTPWHGVLYAGYLMTAGWITLLVLRHWRTGRRGLNAIPVGYGLGVAGVVGWGLAGMLDLGVWHQIFGIEQGLEALLSPTHLLLAATEILIITSPLRAAWSDTAVAARPTFRALLPAVWSAMLATQLVGFMVQYHVAFLRVVPSGSPTEGIAAVLVTNVLLIGPMLLLVRRFRAPLGSFAVLYTGVAVLLGGLTEYEGWPLLLSALAGGVTADVLARRRRTGRGWAPYATVACASSLVLWSTYMAAALRFPFHWSVELWSGAITLAVASSLGLALLAGTAQGEASPVPATRRTVRRSR